MSVDKSKLKKFYVGKPEVVEGTNYNSWGRQTLPEAIEHAKKLVQESGKPAYIVKVIKVVRKKEQPLVIENLK
jgi:hypothetical protein